VIPLKRLFSRWLMRHSGRILFIGLLIGALGLWGSVLLYQNLRPDFEELLPSSARSVRDLRFLRDRIVGSDYVAVLVFTRNSALAEDFLDHLGASLKREVPGNIGRVEWNVRDTLAFFKDRAALFLPLSRIQDLEHYVAAREQYEKDVRNPMKLLAEEPEFDFEGMSRELRGRAGDVDRFPGGYFANPDRSVYALLAYLPEFSSKVDASYRLSALVKEEVSRTIATDPAFADLQIHFTGGVQDLVEEHSSLMHDVALSTAVVLVLVMLVCWFYYDSWQVLLLLCLSVLVGSATAFGLAYLLEGYVNANSAFLGSIVLGNGINFGIIYLARFVEEMEKRKGVTHAILLAFRKTDTATWVAAASAALSYGALMVTDFRGFRQFGLIGFLGMVCCWVSAFTVLPASLLIAGRNGRFIRRTWRRRGRGFGLGLAFLVRGFPRTILAAGGLATLLSLGLMAHSWTSLLETNMSKLRDRRSEAEGSGFYSRYLHEIFGYPHPTVLLAASRGEATALASALKKRMLKPQSWIRAVHSLDDFLPENMEAKAEILRRVREKVDAFGWNKLRREERRRAKELLGGPALRAFREGELPDFVLRRFREKDGSIGRMVLVEPPHSGEMETGKLLQEYVSEVRETADAVRPGIPVTGQLAVSADLGFSISHAGPRVTSLALLFVTLFVALLFRRVRHVFPVVGALVCSIAWLFGLVIFSGFKINFVNFIAIPITLGISVDYGVNIYQRALQEKRQPVASALIHSGAAVFLASLTTIIGYGSLLLAGNQAISSFGALATFGEITGLMAALLLVPAFLLLSSGAPRDPD
jgi:uncharacterized protein